MPANSPPAAESLFHQATQSLAQGDDHAAEQALRAALKRAPDFAEAHANLGMLLEARGEIDAAEACYRRSLERAPDYAQTHSNLGNLLAARKRFAEAETAHRRAIELAPASAAAWSNLGVLLAALQRDDEAELCLRTAMLFDAGFAKARFNLSYLLLRQGRFDEGWACLEARPCVRAPVADGQRWQGEALHGKSLLVWVEGGHGDMIQFCRYLPLLKAQGAAHITLVCHAALRPLLDSLAGVDAVCAHHAGTHVPRHDYWVYPLSLPHFFRTELASIPATIPYLHAPPARLEVWNERLPRDGLRVGLAWQGNPAYDNDADRSLPSLAVLAPLAELDGVAWISVQHGDGADQARMPPPGMALLDLGSEISDFADTAAIVAQLDLLICVDTAVAHLAGALGAPCWLMLNAYKTDWRWLTGRDDTPWYPRMRLFRQPRAGDWAAVVAAIRTALLAHLKTPNDAA